MMQMPVGTTIQRRRVVEGLQAAGLFQALGSVRRALI
jgi:hypothetical protein